MNKIIITGASGFIGKALHKRLLEANFRVVALSSQNGDISKPDYYNGICMKDVSHIYHLAGKTVIPVSWENPEAFFRVNILGTLNTLEICRKHKLSMTYVSAYIYGQPRQIPIREDSQIVPNNPYAHSKYLAEQLCQFYSEQFDIPITIIRPFNVYGPGQSNNFLIPHIISQALFHDAIQVKNLHPKRDFVHLDDLVNALILARLNARKCSIYNIGSGVSTSVRELIDIIQGLLGQSKQIISEGVERQNEIDNVVADISHAKNELAWSSKISLEDGLRQLLNREKGES